MSSGIPASATFEAIGSSSLAAIAWRGQPSPAPPPSWRHTQRPGPQPLIGPADVRGAAEARSRQLIVKGMVNESPCALMVYWYVPITRPPTEMDRVTGVWGEPHMLYACT